MLLTSPPAQNARPAPVNTMHLTLGSDSALASCTCNDSFADMFRNLGIKISDRKESDASAEPGDYES